MEASSEFLVRVFIFFLYVSVIPFCYWRFIPRLLPPFRILATIMLMAQALFVVIALENHPSDIDEWWLWHLNPEGNIPDTFASAQLMLVGVVALAALWSARGLSAMNRLYLVIIGILFVLLAWEEFYEQRKRVFGDDWEVYGGILGAALVAASIVGFRSLRSTWKWHIVLLAGLAMSAFGAIVVEQAQFHEICDKTVSTHGERCLRYFYEEPLEMLGVWLALLAVLGHFSAAAPKPRRFIYILLYLSPLLWTIVNHGPYSTREFDFRFLSQPAAIKYESKVELQAFRIDRGNKSIALRFFARVSNWEAYSGLGYSMHLVDQVTGESVAGADETATRGKLIRSRGRIRTNYIFEQDIATVLPQDLAVNRALWIVLTTWREDGNEYVPQRIASSDRQLLSDTQVVLGELVLPGDSIAAATVQLASFDHGLSLGFVQLPAKVIPGDTLSVPFSWRAESDGLEEYTQFLHFTRDEGGDQWGYDQQPLGARLPTRLWYRGLADAEIWPVPIPADLAPGTYKVFTGLYRASDLARLPARDAEGNSFADARVPLGSLILVRA